MQAEQVNRVVVLAGGVGGSRFVTGARLAFPGAELSVIVNTADDITLHGLRICPDLDTMMYTLGGGNDTERGWGRADEGWRVMAELAAYQQEPTWFSLGDRDLGTHLVRAQLLAQGLTPTQVTARLARRWLPAAGIRLLPMTDQPVETRLTISDADGVREVHFQEYWVRYHAAPRITQLWTEGLDRARPSEAVTEAIEHADVVLVAPSNPVVSISPIINVPGMIDLLVNAAAPIVGFSGIIAGAPLLGMAHKLLPVIGVEVSAAAVARFYGARARGALLDAWVVDNADAAAVPGLVADGIATGATDLLMRTPEATADIIRFGLGLLA